MTTISKRIISFLLLFAMLATLVPTVAFAQDEIVPCIAIREEADDAETISDNFRTESFKESDGIPRKADEIYYRIDNISDFGNDTYLFIARASGTYASYSAYALQPAEDDTYYALKSVGANIATAANSLSATSGLGWTVTVSNGVLTIKDSSGNYLSDTTQDGNIRLQLSTTACTWTPVRNTNGAFSFKSSKGNYLALRDDLDVTDDDGNRLVLFCVSNALTTGSCYFDVYRKTCTHVFNYRNLNNGKHTATCASGCGYSVTEECTLVNGKCSYCGFSGIVNYTVTFITPNGVDPIDPIECASITLPAPTGTPINNYNNARFVGWTTGVVDNTTSAPEILKTTGTYTIMGNLTLYALYAYGGTITFTRYDGTNTIQIGKPAIIVAADSDYAIGRQQNSNNRSAASVTKNSTNNTITVDAGGDVAIFTVGWGYMGTAETYRLSFSDENGYLYASSSSGNYLRSKSTLDEHGTWELSLDSATANVAITSQGGATRNIIRFNPTHSLFAAYQEGNTQKDVQLYVYTSESGQTYTTVFDTTCDHAKTTTTTVNATCTEEGSKTVTCDTCSLVISKTIIPATGHKYVEKVTPPTCTENGFSTFTCSVCGDSYEDNFTPVEGHDYEAVVTPPTCTESGFTTYTCSVCGDSYEDDFTPMGDHEYETVVTDPTCESAGYTTYTCIHCSYTYKYDYLPPLEHDYIGEVTIEATCTEDGLMTYTCSVCFDSYTEILMSDGEHTYDVEVTIETGCTTDGLLTFTCKYCDDSYTEVVLAEGHNYIETIIEPTCIEMGYTDFTCDGCGDNFTTNFVPTVDHTYEGEITTKPTCTEDGLMTYTCPGCGDYYTEIIFTDGHVYDDGVMTSEPTCTDEGIITFSCTGCDDFFEEIVMPNGHDFDEGKETQAPKCATPGIILYTCNTCGETEEDEIPAPGHDYTEEVTPPTCTTSGYSTYTCETCGYSMIANDMAATGHNYSIVVTDPTCTAKGYSTYTCENCGINYKAREVAALGHSYDEGIVTTEPTCTAEGVMTFSCERCDDFYTESIAIKHELTTAIETAPTCTAKGLEKTYCTLCGLVTETRTLASTGHNYVTTTVEPNCSSGGYTKYTCSSCGNSYDGDYTEPSGHNYTRIRTAPTCTEKGYTTYICYGCNDSYIANYTPATGHTLSYTFTDDAHTQVCANCDYAVVGEHDWDEGTLISEPTCITAGITQYSCSICNGTKAVFTETAGHSLILVPEKAATCTENGNTEYSRCENCGKTFLVFDGAEYELDPNYVIIEASGHSYTYTANGASHIIGCSNCNFSEAANHEFADGSCICGAKEVNDPIVIPALNITPNISIGAEIQVMYTIPVKTVSSYAKFYLEVTKTVAGSESIVTTYGMEDGMIAFEEIKSGANVVAYRVTYTGIGAKNMGDDFTATLYALTADGIIYCGSANTTSIKSYIMSKLDDASASAKFKRLGVDMLNYGAAAQITFNYDTENLVNADLTDAQKALGTQVQASAVNKQALTGSGAMLVTSVSVQNKVMLYVTAPYSTSDSSGLKFVIKDASNGTVLAELTPNKVGNAYQCVYENVGAKQMREMITIELQNNGTTVSRVLTWSVESYVAATRANANTSEALLNMVNALLIYGDSAAAYLAK